MDWETKFAAINALTEATLKMRRPGDWYVSQRVEVKSGPFLKGRYGNGRTPEEAVNEHWQEITELAPNEYLIVGAYSDNRSAIRWNGFMWDRVKEEAA